MSENNKERGKHKTKIVIRFADIDSLGHVNNAKYLTYMESARINYFKEVVGQKVNWSKEGFILAKVILDFKRPIFFKDGHVLIFTKCSRIGNKSFELTSTVLRSENGQELATCISTLVAYSYGENKTIAVPLEWKKEIYAYEGGDLIQ